MSDETDRPRPPAGDAAAEARRVQRHLADPFPAHLVRWLPKAKASTHGRRPCVPYVEVATVVERLDDALGVRGWQSRYTVAGEGLAVCELSACVAGEWVVRTDVGSAPPKDDAGNRLKAAFSDALKRAAARLGVGHYLAHVPRQWLDYDDQARRVKGGGQLPAWALPGGSGRPPGEPAAADSARVAAALKSAFGVGPDAVAFSVARLAHRQAVAAGLLAAGDRQQVRDARRAAAERLKLNDPGEPP